ncbi:hypothetical protein L3X38_038684 [Prunus dulcis]|uniref:Uncharacterized protein n=1 Tax=Prunus dulcis TaxID=3755 RepID=A0AAD4V7X3_PRUDU|nr:hypothetical protein L3X38_038684 [Prunus dulcis]
MLIKFWGEAVNTAVYILYRCPISALKNKTLFEAFSGRKPGVKHLRIFGSLCYTHIPSQLRHKLEETGENGVFVGYGTCEKRYKVFNMRTQKVIVSRSVMFDEKTLWNWEANDELHVSIPWDSSEESRITEGEEEFESPNQTLESPSVRSSPNAVTTSAQEKRQASPRPNEIETSEPYDHTCLKWKSLNEVFAQYKVSIVEPESFAEATQDEAWNQVMREEISMIEKDSTWEMVERPGNKPVVGVRWIFKTKLNLDGSIQKHKAKLVAKGYTQKPEVDFNETFAPVARLDIIRTLIALAAQKNWKIFQLDVKSAFLNGVLKEEVYIEQPEGFEVKGAKDKVYKLRKALYGLKQAPRA